MPHLDFEDDDEDWYDDDDAPDDGDPVPCPECGKPVYDFLDRCPACGYWLSESDVRTRRAGMSKPSWLRTTAIIVLIVMLLSLLAGGVAFF
jgi:hypothetical protein